jgi:hypothetical protein
MSKGIIVVIVLILAFVGIYYFGTKVKPENLTPTGQTNQTENNSAPLQTYRSNSLGFSFKYPEGWIVKEAAPGEVIIKSGYDVPDDVAPISIDATGIEPYKSATEAVRLALVGKTEKRIQVGAYEGVQITGSLSGDIGESAGLSVIYTILNREGSLFSIDFTKFSSTPVNGKDVYNGIVASFTFSN